MKDRDAAPRKRPSPSLSGINVGSADIAAFRQFQTKYYSSITLYYTVLLCTTEYYNVLLQCYSVLQSATPVLFRTTKYYSSTSPYVLFRTTKYYSTTILYYNVILQYYSVLQSTTPYYSSFYLYYNVLLQY